MVGETASFDHRSFEARARIFLFKIKEFDYKRNPRLSMNSEAVRVTRACLTAKAGFNATIQSFWTCPKNNLC
jgi:hypothetical protein